MRGAISLSTYRLAHCMRIYSFRFLYKSVTIANSALRYRRDTFDRPRDVYHQIGDHVSKNTNMHQLGHRKMLLGNSSKLLMHHQDGIGALITLSFASIDETSEE